MNHLSPALLRALGNRADGLTVTVFDTVDSTNNAAKAEAHRDTPALYIARAQTGGRGRLGRSFHSPAHTGLYMTVAYTTERPLTEAVRVTAAAAVAAVAAIETLSDKRPAVKWVNDLYLNGGKLGGILTEAVTRPDGRHRMIVGLGINLTTAVFPEDLRAPASCLFSAEETAATPTPFADALAGEITLRLLELAEADAACDLPGGMWGEACLDFYRRHLLWVGEPVVCTRGNESFSGILRGVDGAYSLLVETPNGLLTLSSGEISLRSARSF